MCIKPRVILRLHQLEHNPLSVTYARKFILVLANISDLCFPADVEDGENAIIYGDDGGYVNTLYMPKRFWSETLSEMTPVEVLTPQKIMKANLNRNGLHLHRKKCHNDWVTKITFNTEFNSWISCSPDREKSLVVGDMDRRSVRFGSILKGVSTFDVCKRPSFIITGGRDKML